MNFRALGLEGGIRGGNRGFLPIGLTSFDLKSALGWRWINDEVLEAVIVKTIRRMSRYTFKIQFQDTFAWMIRLNSLFFLGERQPTVMKYVWEKIHFCVNSSSIHRQKLSSRMLLVRSSLLKSKEF